jgi:hypothetical protein
MVNSEEFFVASPAMKSEAASGWKHVSPTTAVVPVQKIEMPQNSLRDWWHTLGGGRAPA